MTQGFEKNQPLYRVCTEALMSKQDGVDPSGAFKEELWRPEAHLPFVKEQCGARKGLAKSMPATAGKELLLFGSVAEPRLIVKDFPGRYFRDAKTSQLVDFI